MRQVGLVVHPEREAASEAAAKLVAWLTDRGVRTRYLEASVGEMDTPDLAGPDLAGPDLAGGLDLMISVGGDGTFLRAAYLASRCSCPVLGVKVGRMGFLTEVEPQEAPAVLERVIEETARIEDRLAVVAEADGTAPFSPQWALNELMVEKAARHRIVRLAMFVGEDYVTTFSADGVIVATPTGSTAYSFSAGGPIVSPTVGCLVVTPVAAHMVFDRSLVLAPVERVTLEVVGEEPGLLSADGRKSLELPVGARVRIGAASRPARIVRPDGAPEFHALVRTKFDLPGDLPGSGPDTPF